MKICKEHVEKIINEENEWYHSVKTDVAQGTMEKVTLKEIMQARQRMKSGKTTGPLEEW